MFASIHIIGLIFSVRKVQAFDDDYSRQNDIFVNSVEIPRKCTIACTSMCWSCSSQNFEINFLANSKTSINVLGMCLFHKISKSIFSDF